MNVIKSELIKLSPNHSIEFSDSVYRIESYKVLDMDTAKYLSIFLRTIIEGGVKKILVDLQNLKFIDSTGIGILINTTKILRSRNGELALLNVPATIEEIFKPVNLQKFIKTFDSQDDAVDFFKGI